MRLWLEFNRLVRYLILRHRSGIM